MIFTKFTDSETILTELMIPSYANFGGKVHGGIILSLMDKVAYVRFASVYKDFKDTEQFMRELSAIQSPTI